MSDLKVTGKVQKVYPVNQISDSFKKRDLIIVTDENYPQTLKLEFVQDAVNKIDDEMIGKDVTCHFNLRGREFKNKEGKMVYFVSLNCWRIVVGNATASVTTASEIPADDSDDSELPF